MKWINNIQEELQSAETFSQIFNTAIKRAKLNKEIKEFEIMKPEQKIEYLEDLLDILLQQVKGNKYEDEIYEAVLDAKIALGLIYDYIILDNLQKQNERDNPEINPDKQSD